tara:strand:+ start:112323 stop:113315 length:993 start_codon:yes stop_codon:yes gene_type:complete
MTSSRSVQVNLEATPYYHCMTRCVRRSFLCGVDSYTNKDYSHRKEWMLARLKTLASVFSIKICAYAIMANHYHLVLHVDAATATQWSDTEVVQRWSAIYPRDARLNAKKKLKVLEWRSRLYDISWFMRCLNEPLARTANKEDCCKGRFWEGRFKSQALLDEGAVLSAMVYVDLNPIRAGIANTPEESEFTSIYERIKTLKNQLNIDELKNYRESLNDAKQTKYLSPLKNTVENESYGTIDIPLCDYLDLVDYTGRAVRENKRGSIPPHLESILQRLQLNNSGWFSLIQNFSNSFSYAIGNEYCLRDFSQRQKRKRVIKGLNAAKQSYLAA